MKSAVQVATPPPKPLLIYDGECNFCGIWIRRWQQKTADRVDYLAYQSPEVGTKFPELRVEELRSAVHFVQRDGAVYQGAEAVFRALAEDPNERWLSEWYEHSPAFAWLAERAYAFVASHRGFFSVLTRVAWGRQVECSTYGLVFWLFLRSLGAIYLVAFLSLTVQVIGLLGTNGIVPAHDTMQAARQEMTAAKVGGDRYHLFPTLCWVATSDAFLRGQCAAGVILALLLMFGIAPAPCLFLLWLIYLSLTTVGREFLSFQWDNLLLETGFLAIFAAPLQLRPRLWSAAGTPRLVLWLLRWLLFRLMFESGCVKLLSGDPTWRNLTALQFHYETQPLPTWIAWYAYQLPLWFQKFSTAAMFGLELLLPFLIFAPRRLRAIAAAGLALLQLLILLTGNYCFFNLLTLALCLMLIDDQTLESWLPPRWRASSLFTRHSDGPAPLRWPIQVTFPLTCIVLIISLIQLTGMFRVRLPWPRPVVSLYAWLTPFRTFNHYGLFAVMTTHRLEIIVEGSQDGATWKAYEFKYKPGDLRRRPRFVEPHQPRLDWQMWFAALGSYRENPWLVNFCVRLLQGSKPILSLLARDPFPNAPPRYIRAILYEYHFTSWATRRKTGDWWQRELKGQYLPALALRTDQ